jgi:hypothetical protein
LRRLLSRRLVAFVVAVSAAALTTPRPSPARPKKGTLAVRVKKLGGGAAKALRTVHVVDASTGEVLFASAFAPSGKATLRPPAAVAFAIATVAGRKGVRSGVSKVFRFDPSKRQSVAVTLRAGPTVAAPRRAAAPRPRYVPGGPVVTMGHVTISDGGHVYGFGDSLLSHLFNGTNDVMTWVDSSTGFLIARAREIALQQDGSTDPFTVITDIRIPPDIQIEGEIFKDGDHITGEITIVDPNTGEVIERIPIDMRTDDLQDFLEQLAREIAKRLRARATTTTTTSTTTTSSSTSSSSTSSTTSSSTTPPTGAPTTTTLPPASCHSVVPASFCECTIGYDVCTSDAGCSFGRGTCVDHVGHTKITFKYAGSGGRLGAMLIETPNDDPTHPDEGLFDFNNGQGVGVLGGCGTPAFTQGAVTPLALDKTSCAAYYHPGTDIVIQAAQNLTAAGAPGPGQPPWCNAVFSSFTGCAPTGCANGKCGCTLVAGASAGTVVATYDAISHPSCTDPLAP